MTIERRSHARTSLRVPVFLVSTQISMPIRAQTENVGVDGFFCYTTQFLAPGEHVRFVLFLPPGGTPPQLTIGVCVRGEAEVVRVGLDSEHGGYGVALRIGSYNVLPDSEIPATEEMAVSMLESSPL